jgi:hypothetical protein
MRRGETLTEWADRVDARNGRLAAAPHFVYRAFDEFGLLLATCAFIGWIITALALWIALSADESKSGEIRQLRARAEHLEAQRDEARGQVHPSGRVGSGS